jgi:predicted helicase
MTRKKLLEGPPMGDKKPKIKIVTNVTKQQKQHVIRVCEFWHYNLKALAMDRRRPLSRILAEIFEEYFKWNQLTPIKYEHELIKKRKEKSRLRTKQNKARTRGASRWESKISRSKPTTELFNELLPSDNKVTDSVSG